MKEHYRILLVHNKYKLAGGEDTLAINECKMLREHGHTVTVYTKENQVINRLSILNKLLVPLRLIYSQKLFKELQKIIRDENIQIIHAINIVPLIGFTLYLAADHMNIPIIQDVNNFRYVCPGGACMRDGRICEECIKKNSYISAIKYGCYRKSKLQTFCLCTALVIHKKIGSFERVNKYIVPSLFNKSKLNAIVKEKDKIIVQEPSVPDTYESFTPANKRHYYVYAARLERLKGIQVAIKSFENLNAKLVILGTGEDEDTIKKYVLEHSMNNIEFWGFKNICEMRNIFKGAKALIYPTQWYEGIPLTLLEAFAQGTPVIGSNIGNVGACITEGYNGITFQYDDFCSLKAAVYKMEIMCQSDNIYKNARETYEKKYTETINYCNFKKILDEAISGEIARTRA